MSGSTHRLWRATGKRAADVVLSAAALVVLSPVLLVVAVLVRVRLGNPVLFRHERPGLDGQPFTLLKFRTMTDDTDARGRLLPDDVRLTPFGRRLRATSLDELPELVNVLRGDMSLVGPRPLLTEYLDRYSPTQARRHEVRPGLTGWAQVNGRNDASWGDKLAMDVWYVDNVSPMLDARVVWQTVAVVVGAGGVTREGHATAPVFQGTDGEPEPRIDPTTGLPITRRRPPRAARSARSVAPAAAARSVAPAATTTGHDVEPATTTATTEADGPVAETGVSRAAAASELEVRRATDDDVPQVLDLLQASLGWVPDTQYAAFFAWKHHANPYGRSPAWVAVDGDRVVGFRTWMRWAFEDAQRRWTAVRAVDTATHPDYQGRGIFRRLTTSSVDELREDGVDFVFNTPNEQSRPGYLKMGWSEVGTLPVRVRPTSVTGIARMARSRVPADKWSVPCTGGISVDRALADEQAIAELIAARGPATRLRTALDLDVLRWRYGFADLHYRAVMTTDRDALAFFRVRRRGAASEAVIGHVLASSDELETSLLSRVASVSGADYALRISDDAAGRGGYLPLPGQGPVLTWRDLAHDTMPPLDSWELCMGDVELF